MKCNLTKEELEIVVRQSVNMRHLLELVSLAPKGGNYKVMKRRLDLLNISTVHWGSTKQRQGHLKGKTHNWAIKTPLSEVLIENYMGGIISHKLKLRLIKEGFLHRKCYECGGVEWRGYPIPIELEHKNGNTRDNRLDNLTLLCPNCHALTPTYRRRKKK